MSYSDQDRSSEGAWEKLSQVAVKGAEYNSRERQPHPKCLKGTRVDLLDHMYGLLDNSTKSRLIWLHGTAGVGKSAAAFTVAERMRGLKVTEQRSEKRLAGTFFFSRKHTKRCTTGYFFATLAYQLAVNFPSIRDDVSEDIRENSALLDPDKPLEDQMEALFLRPLRRLRLRLRESPPLVFIIDALDECTSEAEITDLVSLFGQALHEPDLPMTHILLTSRSEAQIRNAFQQEGVHSLVCEIPVKISGEGVTTIISLDGADVDNDICIFLEHSFKELRSRYPNFPQPTEHALARLASRAGRRFIVATTIMKFIDDGYNDPHDRLQLMLELTSKLLPGTELYKLYDRVLSTCANPKRAYHHLSVIAALADPLPISQISELLGPGEGRDVETVLVQLRSVVDIPTDDSLPINIYHSSVRDYVSNLSNSSLQEVQCITSPHLLLAHRSFCLMIQHLSESTALLDALSELQSQSQAMQSHDPGSLKHSLSFIIQPLEPLRVLIGLLWLRGDHSLKSWLKTLDGYAWLQTQSGQGWLRTMEGQDWLQTNEGRGWLQMGPGKSWQQIAGGRDWLQTQEGQDWLQTHGGKGWLHTQGRDWLWTHDGQQWLLAKSGQTWLLTWGGQHWLQAQHGQDWLQTQSGGDWLQTQSGQDWLQTIQRRRGWLQTQSGQDWLQTQSGQDWLQTQRGQKWLQTQRLQQDQLHKEELRQGWEINREQNQLQMQQELGSEQDWQMSDSNFNSNWRYRLPTGGGTWWLSTRNGQCWLLTEEGQGWLLTEEGQGWLSTRNGLGWLLLQAGQDWLLTEAGKGWLATRNGQVWLLLQAGQDWLLTEGGQDWLPTRGGNEWLLTQAGQDWLSTRGGNEWLLTQAGQDWLPTRGGNEWLLTQAGQNWLSTRGGNQWLLAEGGHGWLSLQAGQDWLLTQAGQDWLPTRGGNQWLLAKGGQDWLLTQAGQDWLPTRGGNQWLLEEGGQDWLLKQAGQDWLLKQAGQDWLKTQGGQDWFKTCGGQDWLKHTDGQDWLQTLVGQDWLRNKDGQDWLKSKDGQDWLQIQRGLEWLQSQGGRAWLQTQDGQDWLQTKGGQDWLQTSHGQVWQSTPAASFWATMEEFSSTLEEISKFMAIPKLSFLPTSISQAIHQFRSLPDFLMFPAFLALRYRDPMTYALPHPPFPANTELIHAMKAFVAFARAAQEQSQAVSGALNYACQNWVVHLSRTPNSRDDMLDHVFKAFWNCHLLSWLERQWCLKGLRSCLVILSEGQELAKTHLA